MSWVEGESEGDTKSKPDKTCKSVSRKACKSVSRKCPSTLLPEKGKPLKGLNLTQIMNLIQIRCSSLNTSKEKEPERYYKETWMKRKKWEPMPAWGTAVWLRRESLQVSWTMSV